ncbi:hypothetical protein, partial [Ruegeria sp. HU-ET01832]|uniref:hypothetical protein n=1 Tax=Ruegeria sp. HU-ET01832 TaxID=3135906 RepID=UPI003342729B
TLSQKTIAYTPPSGGVSIYTKTTGSTVEVKRANPHCGERATLPHAVSQDSPLNLKRAGKACDLCSFNKKNHNPRI